MDQQSLRQAVLFTIGHSTRPIDEFIELLKQSEIDTLADVRSYPGSRRYPWFGKSDLGKSLDSAGINYIHIPGLGGRRYKQDNNEQHNAWNEASFRNYAAYASSSDDFKNALDDLLKLDDDHKVSIMCSEAVWWRCHRRIITDYILTSGHSIKHILSKTKIEQAALTKFAKPIEKVVYYPKGDVEV